MRRGGQDGPTPKRGGVGRHSTPGLTLLGEVQRGSKGSLLPPISVPQAWGGGIRRSTPGPISLEGGMWVRGWPPSCKDDILGSISPTNFTSSVAIFNNVKSYFCITVTFLIAV